MVVTVCSTGVIVCSTGRLEFVLQKSIGSSLFYQKYAGNSLFYYERQDVEQTKPVSHSLFYAPVQQNLLVGSDCSTPVKWFTID